MLVPQTRCSLQRFYGRNDLHFVTFSCYHRVPLLGSPSNRTCFVEMLDTTRHYHGFLLLGYVVMPEHVHLLISEPTLGTPVANSSGPQAESIRKTSGDTHQFGLLAAALLRFQYLEFGKTGRETHVHSQQSDRAGTCIASSGLAMEQLVLLHAKARADSNRHALVAVVENQKRVMQAKTVESKSKTAPSEG